MTRQAIFEKVEFETIFIFSPKRGIRACGGDFNTRRRVNKNALCLEAAG